jgi:hypothetical protein
MKYRSTYTAQTIPDGPITSSSITISLLDEAPQGSTTTKDDKNIPHIHMEIKS